jgi:hypothetical protein
MLAQLRPYELQTCHWYAYEVGEPVQAPVELLTPAVRLGNPGPPVSVGAVVLVGLAVTVEAKPSARWESELRRVVVD